MLFKFKSKASADLIMLEADGRRLLKAMIGDDPVQGIVRAADLPPALARLEAAVAEDEALRKARAEEQSLKSPQDEAPEPALPAIRLAQRALPMQQMVRRAIAEDADLLWGV